MPRLPTTQKLLLALAIAAACALPGCKRASEAIAEKAIEQASGDKVDIKQDGDTVSIKTDQGEMKVATAQDGGSVALPADFPGDVFLPEEQVRGFEVVGCVECGGVLKPDVVFFGENVPRPRVEQCYSLVDNARSLLVLGSSLTVMSGLRFVRRAADAGIPVVIINRGVTRGDPYASLRVDLPLGKSLTELADVVLQSGNGDLPGR